MANNGDNKFPVDCPHCGQPLSVTVQRDEKREPSDISPLGLIDEDTAAASLRISTRTLQRYRAEGRIQFFRVGIKAYYTREQISAYLNGRSCASIVRKRLVRVA